MKKIMIRAWEIYRTLEGDHRAKLALALRQAWKEAKRETPESIIEKLRAQGLKVKRWTKYGNDRLYVSGFHYSKEYYIDLSTMTAYPNRPGCASNIESHALKAGLSLKIA